MKKNNFILVLFTFFLILPANASLTLIGDTVDFSQIGSSAYDLYCPESSVVGPGLEFVIGYGPVQFFNIDIGSNTISILACREDSDAPLEELSDVIIKISDLDWIGYPDWIITDAILTFNEDVPELTQDDIFFTADSVTIVLGESSDPGGSTTWINNQLVIITLEASLIPEPATLLLFGFGVMMVIRKR